MGTVTLLEMNGSHGSVSFSDSSSAKGTVSSFGSNAYISTAQSRYGGSSLYFDGNPGWVRDTHASKYNFGTGPFTVEMWVYVVSGRRIEFFDSRGAGGAYLELQMQPGRELYSINGNTWHRLGPSYLLPLNTWVHLASCRSGSTLKVFADGVELDSVGDGRAFNSAGYFTFGDDSGSPGYAAMHGYMDNIRVSNVARYTSDFIPPVAPFITPGRGGMSFPVSRASVF